MHKEPSPLSGLYLEDSYFLGLFVSGAILRLRGLFALTQDHEAYLPPLANEQHCYREGEIALTGIEVAEWKAGRPALSSDPDGSMDLGSIAIEQRTEGYRISTDWFDMTCRTNALKVTLD